MVDVPVAYSGGSVALPPVSFHAHLPLPPLVPRDSSTRKLLVDKLRRPDNHIWPMYTWCDCGCQRGTTVFECTQGNCKAKQVGIFTPADATVTPSSLFKALLGLPDPSKTGGLQKSGPPHETVWSPPGSHSMGSHSLPGNADSAPVLETVRDQLFGDNGQGVVQVLLSALPQDLQQLVQTLRHLHQQLLAVDKGPHQRAARAAGTEPMYQHQEKKKFEATALSLAQNAWKTIGEDRSLPSTEFGRLPNKRTAGYQFDLMVGCIKVWVCFRSHVVDTLTHVFIACAECGYSGKV